MVDGILLFALRDHLSGGYRRASLVAIVGQSYFFEHRGRGGVSDQDKSRERATHWWVPMEEPPRREQYSAWRPRLSVECDRNQP